MSTPFVGEVRLVGFNFAPVGWQTCAGQFLAISSNDALYALIGTTYGGDGVNTFALPNLQGRVTVHQGQGLGLSSYVMGQLGGVEQVTITSQTYPSHSHPLLGSSNAGTLNTPPGNTLGGDQKIYDVKPGTVPLSNSTVSQAGGTNGPLPHENRQPYLVLNWIIALNGIFPSQG